MATEFKAVRKIRPSSDATSLKHTPEGDHRKRRRNRTTQSCLNCHNSKRMCDRKRPCGRCTQLGLTGLCVYEVDDSSQRRDPQDEGSRLRQRIAELEGVIRELKNKPHLRWATTGSSSRDEFEKCHARSRSSSEDRPTESNQSDASSPPSESTANLIAEPNEPSLEKPTPGLMDDVILPDSLLSSFPPPPTGNPATTLSAPPYSPPLDIYIPPSDPSAGLVTPAHEHSQLHVAVAGDHQLINDIDLASFLMSCPELLACDAGQGQVDHTLQSHHGQYVDPRLREYSHGQFFPVDGHCGCLNEAANYNVVLELSVHLRKAADILSHSAHHRFDMPGHLHNHRTALEPNPTVLGNTISSPNDFNGSTHLCSRSNAALSGPIPPAFSTSSCSPMIRVPAASPPSLRTDLRPWTGVACAPSDTIASGDESFMTWKSSRRA